jgi:DNA (cytosine-5)-methyltransferase 1
MEIKLGIDFDKDAEKTFRRNFSAAEFICRDIKDVTPQELENYIPLPVKRNRKILFTCCAPCQPFSILNRWQKAEEPTEDEKELKRRAEKKKAQENKERLLLEFIRFVRHFKPDFIFIENVPGFQKISSEYKPLSELCKVLDELGYSYPQPKIVEMQRYGVPQRRKRLILIASLLGTIEFPPETHDGKNVPYVTVYDTIGGKNALPEIKAGEKHQEVPNHQSARLSSVNLERIMSLSQGQNRLHLPERLRLRCHDERDGVHTDVYTRLFWDSPATGLTTRCTSLSNGRFGHPEQHRAISAREAARLQTFLDGFVFEGALTSTTRQIGNAVPVLLAQRFGEKFVGHMAEQRKITRKIDG